MQGHVFISYVREDSDRVDELQDALKSAGIPVWRDVTHMGLGLDWWMEVQRAITEDAVVFIACFSTASLVREKTVQRAELTLAAEQYRLRRRDRPWLIPVRFDDCRLPTFDLGAGSTLESLNWLDLFGDGKQAALSRLVDEVSQLVAGIRRHRFDSPTVDRAVAWYQGAVFYEVAVRGFYDSDGDGFGDFAGLTQKLDYLEWLGVDCLWLLPFYQSPLRDGGYDISDFLTVLPESGTIDDVAAFLDESHRRGIRVIADMVMNHTSDQHPWFVESRQDRTNPKADWYVWGDDPERWSEARVIFVDSEPSNWASDNQREQYYWHRFFHHQPDLNYDNPAVADAMLDVVRFWLNMGLDGFRLDAVPYLFERDGTNGENLPETHDYLRRVRKTVDAEFPGRVLLADANQWPPDANQWPADVIDYFGAGDECHMCFHFPLVPRMFMAVRKEQRHPITEILAQTPQVPDGCQWGIFLRNHDELTLEMVSDEDRDYMYSEYATDPRMKLNLGIRRRLFPLLDNDERKVELFHALLFSMPGSPVMYYGDEIGMGDNIYLGDRDGVRTPMQWSPDRNGGFSSADFADLYLPPLLDPVYGYQAVNVEAQQRGPHSFLHRVRDLVAIRKQHPALAHGHLQILHADNPSVLAYLRVLLTDDGRGDETILCVNNLSRYTQPCQLMLEQLKGRVPVELAGRVCLLAISNLPYPLTLAPYSAAWFALVPADALEPD